MTILIHNATNLKTVLAKYTTYKQRMFLNVTNNLKSINHFRLYSNDLDTTPEFPALYRQEPNKMSDEDLLKILSDFRKQEKLSKLTIIPGWLSINIQQSNESIISMQRFVIMFRFLMDIYLWEKSVM